MPLVYSFHLVFILLLSFIQCPLGFAAPLPSFTLDRVTPVQSFTQPAPTLNWQVSIGGSYTDKASAIAAFTDSTYVVVGSTSSTNGDMATDPLAGKVQSAAWVSKLNKQGNKVWFKSYALFPNNLYSYHSALSVATLSSGGCVVAAEAISSAADQKRSPWVFKLDANGGKVWEKTFNASSSLEYSSQTVTVDKEGNYVVAGWVKKPGNAGFGLYDVWVIKLDPTGNLIWEKTFGGSSNEQPSSIISLPEGGYVIAGYTASQDGDVTPTYEGFNCWIVKIDTNGNKVWQKTYGGSYDDRAMSIARTSDGNFVVAGYTSSGDGDVKGYHGTTPPVYGNTFFGFHDFWVLKLDKDGKLIWQKALGGFNDDVSASVSVTAQDEYVVAGSIESADGDVTGYHPPADAYVRRTDYWVIKMSSSGTLIWQKALGGSKGEDAAAVLSTIDGGCIVVGAAESANGDVAINRGYTDAWIVRLNGPAKLACTSVTTGSWNVASTWSCGRLPTALDDVIIQPEHTALLDSGMTEAVCRNLEILGTFSMQGSSILINGTRITIDQESVLTK